MIKTFPYILKNYRKLILIAGLCALESDDIAVKTALYLKSITSKYDDVDLIFKASFDKANRTSIKSFRGIGIQEGLRILNKIRQLGIKVLTDVHCPHQANIAKDYVDVIQLPAFLCRQTDLAVAIGKTGKTVNIKKGQFLAPEDIKYIIEKIESTGNKNIMITERGTCFGYNNLITDYRAFIIMKKFGYTVIFDVTHSQQRPSLTNETGGSTEFVIPMAKGAVATGMVDGLFIECHPNPNEAKSDKATSLNFDQVKQLLKEIIPIWRLQNETSSI